MDKPIRVGQTYYPNQLRPNQLAPKSSVSAGSFQQIFQQKLVERPLQFSNHAEKRLAMRGIELSSDQLQNLEAAVNKAAIKGSKDSLIMMNNVAFVVSVENRTVVTAVDNESMKDNIFTNIDSAMFI